MLAFANMIHLLAYELTRLGACRFAGASITARALECLLLRHKVSPQLCFNLSNLATSDLQVCPLTGGFGHRWRPTLVLERDVSPDMQSRTGGTRVGAQAFTSRPAPRRDPMALTIGSPAFAADGPQPPPGHGMHHYHFRIFALDVAELDVPPECLASDVLAAAEEHALEQTEVIGTFEKSDGARPAAQATEAPQTDTRGVQRHVADADKIVRTGSVNEPVRNTPPAGDWNDTA